MTTNPSHILIARNSRSLNNPAALLSSPTETHAAASGIFRSSGSPSWLHDDVDGDESVSNLSTEEDEEAIDIHETFTRECKLPGTVKVVVETTTFWVHKEILFFSSPFFEAALGGDWSETGRPLSIASTITIPSQYRIDNLTTNVDSDASEQENDPVQSNTVQDISLSDNEEPGGPKPSNTHHSSDSAEALDTPTPLIDQSSSQTNRSPPQGFTRRRPRSVPEAVILLKEEKVSVYHCQCSLECTITWNNVAGLMNISHKLCVTSLQQECLTFLLTHAAGKPIKALRIAEIFQEEELYREASRFVLDNPGGWTEQELNTLTQETLLKLEKRRNWFLERVLKLGLTMVSKEYQCCSTCPDPPTCARLLEEKWKQAYHAVFRFGPPQPSMVFRYLRMMEGVSPPLSLTHTACQASAKSFIATRKDGCFVCLHLFDRMFSLGVRGSGTEAPPIGPRGVTSASSAVVGPRRHFLYCTLKPDSTHRARKSRE
ncbi:hypothetical protein BJ165DRAFT_1413875 [Panaeolus papilionaceus]|nr:hypothetical protein BJ165DRAFT_1413875 [Panaeolus papilionaceus]